MLLNRIHPFRFDFPFSTLSLQDLKKKIEIDNCPPSPLDSIRSDCLTVPLECLSLSFLDEPSTHSNTPLAPLAKIIAQFSDKERQNIYLSLTLSSSHQQELERLIETDKNAFEIELLKILKRNWKGENRSDTQLDRICKELGIKLIVLDSKEQQPPIIKESCVWSAFQLDDSACFTLELNRKMGEEQGLFDFDEEGVASVCLDSETLPKIGDMLSAIQKMKREILAFLSGKIDSDQLAYAAYCQENEHRPFDPKVAFYNLFEAEEAFKGLFQLIKNRLHQQPLAVMLASSDNEHSSEKQWRAFDLNILKEESDTLNSSLGIARACEDLLFFIEQEEVGLNDTLYGDEKKRVKAFYQEKANSLFSLLSIQESCPIDQITTKEKIQSLLILFHSHLPSRLRCHDRMEAYFKDTSSIRLFLEKKREIGALLEEIKGLKPSGKKAAVRRALKGEDLSKGNETVAKLNQAATDEQATDILFEAIYGEHYSDSFEQYCQSKRKYRHLAHLNPHELVEALDRSQNIENEQSHNTSGEKSLDQLCIEYQTLNQVSSSVTDEFKRKILTIRGFIREITQGKQVPNDIHQVYPLAVIAQICVKIDSFFHLQIRDTQLFAILSMLESVGQGNSVTHPIRGTLCELKTGEGKSLVIAVCAIIFNQKGLEVDVITFSPSLAKRDWDHFHPFYQQMFGIFSSHNCNGEGDLKPNPCYQPKSIVYGPWSNFQADTIRSEFYQGQTLNGRPKHVAIIDEVDAPLLGEPGSLCQISDAVAGMSTVKPILYYIWGLVIKKLKEMGEKTFQNQTDYEAFVEEMKQEVMAQKGEFFADTKEGRYLGVLPHLRSFVDNRIPHWVDSAIKAASYTHKQEYYASESPNQIIPIDYSNTGEWQKSVRWQDGLHEFLSIRHGFELETEMLTKAFMSYLGLINRYQFVFGASGTLGGDKEAEVFQNLYQVQSRKIPTFKTSQFKEKESWICQDDEEWLQSIYSDVVLDGTLGDPLAKSACPQASTKRHRASLIVCETIADVEKINAYFTSKGLETITYTNGEQEGPHLRKASKGTIIIATNLASRGTDIEASAIEGGIHVILTYLPENARVHSQVFGRSARGGLPGTGRLIIKAQELQAHHVQHEYAPLLKVVNDVKNSNLKGLNIQYRHELWHIQDDLIVQGKRTLQIEKLEGAKIKKTIELSHNGTEGDQALFNQVLIDRVKSADPSSVTVCFSSITYESLMRGRDAKEAKRLDLLHEEKEKLIKKEALFKGFQEKFHQVESYFQLEERFSEVKTQLVELYKTYLLDEWALFLDRVVKNEREPTIRQFQYAKTLQEMIEVNDLYKVQYFNTIIDIPHDAIHREANLFYELRGRKQDITGAFANYNRIFTILKTDPANIDLVKNVLNRSLLAFQEAEQYERSLLQVRRMLSESKDASDQEEMMGTEMLKMILTMTQLISDHLKEIESIEKEHSQFDVCFENPWDLSTSSSAQQKNENKETSTTKKYAIVDGFLPEAIRLGLKGPLRFSAKKQPGLAIFCAILAIAVIALGVAAIVFSGGAFAPLISILGSAAIGAGIGGAMTAITGAINGNFSLSSFGKEMLIGFVAGFVTGGIGAGLGHAAKGAHLMATTLKRTAVTIGIGGLSGAAGQGAGYLVRSGVDKQTVSAEQFGKALFYGGVGGLIGGAGGTVFSKCFGSKMHWEVLAGGLNNLASNASEQGLKILLKEQKEFDGWGLLKSALSGFFKAGIQKQANHWKAVRETSRQNVMLRRVEKVAEMSRNWKREENKKALDTLAHLKIRSMRRRSLDEMNNSRMRPDRSSLDYLDLANPKGQKVLDGYMKFSKLEPYTVSRVKLDSQTSMQPIRLQRSLSMGDLRPSVQKPFLFPKERAWTNVPPKIISNKPTEEKVKQPSGESFKNFQSARNAAFLDARIIKGSIIEKASIKLSGDHTDDGIINATKIYQTDLPYQYNGRQTSFVAVQIHSEGHPALNFFTPHCHVRPAYFDEKSGNFHVISNKNLPQITNDNSPSGFKTQEHYYYPKTG
ncbi:MAG: hypothetical protein ACH350_08410 [Parachlamydiaceae bacterium]